MLVVTSVGVTAPVTVNAGAAASTSGLTLTLGIFDNRALATFTHTSMAGNGFVGHAVRDNGSTRFPMFNHAGTRCLGDNGDLSSLQRGVRRNRHAVIVSNLLAASYLMFSLSRFVTRCSFHSPCTARLNRTLTVSVSTSVLTRITGRTLGAARGITNLNGNNIIRGRLTANSALNVGGRANVTIHSVLLRIGTGVTTGCIPRNSHCYFMAPRVRTTLTAGLSFLGDGCNTTTALAGSGVVDVSNFRVVRYPRLARNNSSPAGAVRNSKRTFPSTCTDGSPLLVYRGSSINILSLGSVDFRATHHTRCRTSRLVTGCTVNVNNLHPRSAFVNIVDGPT